MAALPKKKISRVRGRTRRAHSAIKLSRMTVCTNCRQPKPGHIVCPECGFYAKKKVLNTKTDQRIAKQLKTTQKAEALKSKEQAKEQKKAKLKAIKDAKSAKKAEVKAEAKGKNTRTTDEIKSSQVKNK